MEELFETALSQIGYGDAYFMWPDDDARLFRALVRASTQQDPEWTAAFLRWLRAETPMRYPALVGAAQFVGERLAGGEHGMSRQVVASVLRNADDPGHLLAYWTSTYGPRVPKPVKRGIADALERMTTPKFDAPVPRFLRVRMDIEKRKAPRPMRTRDVIALTHAKIRDLPAPVRHSREMSLPDLLTNLRRFDAAAIPFEAAMKIAERIIDPHEIRRSGVGPMRYFAAWRAVATQRWPLADGVAHSVAALPRLAGRTLIVLNQDSVEAVAFGLALAQTCSHADVFSANNKPFDLIEGESPLHSVIRWQAMSHDRSAEELADVLQARFADHDRLVYVGVYTAELKDVEPPADVPFYPWLTDDPTPPWSRYSAERSWPALHGIDDVAYQVIPLWEAAKDGIWPWTGSTMDR